MNWNYILTPCVVKTTIICSVVLLVLLCITSLIKNLYGAKDNCNNCHKRKHLSYKYVVGILIFLLVILFSHKFYKYDNIFNFLSFASAIISIILAILTMIYTYYTQGNTTSSAEKIEKASAEIAKAVKSVQEATQAYEGSATSLQQNIESITASINHVEEQTNQILIEQMENNQKESSSGQSFSMNKEDIRGFVESTSHLGIIALYAAHLAHKHKKAFNLNEIDGGEHEAWYTAGFIISTSSFNLLEAELDYQKDGLCISVSEFEPQLSKLVNSKIDKKIKDKNDFYITNKKAVDSFFEKNNK